MSGKPVVTTTHQVVGLFFGRLRQRLLRYKFETRVSLDVLEQVNLWRVLERLASGERTTRMLYFRRSDGRVVFWPSRQEFDLTEPQLLDVLEEIVVEHYELWTESGDEQHGR